MRAFTTVSVSLLATLTIAASAFDEHGNGSSAYAGVPIELRPDPAALRAEAPSIRAGLMEKGYLRIT